MHPKCHISSNNTTLKYSSSEIKSAFSKGRIVVHNSISSKNILGLGAALWKTVVGILRDPF